MKNRFPAVILRNKPKKNHFVYDCLYYLVAASRQTRGTGGFKVAPRAGGLHLDVLQMIISRHWEAPLSLTFQNLGNKTKAVFI